jgi:hypothetical protein
MTRVLPAGLGNRRAAICAHGTADLSLIPFPKAPSLRSFPSSAWERTWERSSASHGGGVCGWAILTMTKLELRRHSRAQAGAWARARALATADLSLIPFPKVRSFAALVPKLCLGTHVGAKLCFARRGCRRGAILTMTKLELRRHSRAQARAWARARLRGSDGALPSSSDSAASFGRCFQPLRPRSMTSAPP